MRECTHIFIAHHLSVETAMSIDMLSGIVKRAMVKVIFTALGELLSMTITIQVVQCQMELMV